MRKPIPDDSPAPVRMTPKRLADQLLRLADDLARVGHRLRELAIYADTGERLDTILDRVQVAALRTVDLAGAVRVGRFPIAADLLDADAGKGARPLLDRLLERECDQADGRVPLGDELVDVTWPRVPTSPPGEPPGDRAADGASPAPKRRRKPREASPCEPA